MKNTSSYLPTTLFLLLLCFQQGLSQNNSFKIMDAKSGEAIPYANIRVNTTENLLSNAEGNFSLAEGNTNDSAVLAVSYMGYVSREITLGELKSQQNILKLEPAVYELDNVMVAKRPDADAIMVEVNKNLKPNYITEPQDSKDLLFLREVSSIKPTIMDIDITKSTGFSKQSLATTNAELEKFGSDLKSQPPKEFKDVLCNYYQAIKKIDGKNRYFSRLEVVKATKLSEENKSASLEDMKKTASAIFLKHLDPNKYYRIKSGLFGSRDTVSLKNGFDNSKNKIKNPGLFALKNRLSMALSENNFLYSYKTNFVNHPELYDYTYEGAIYQNGTDFVYVLGFKPKKSDAKYTGKLYISESDYAVLRADYTLAEGKKVSGFNMKFLLGVKTAENLSKGTIIYKQNPSGKGYFLQYASMEKGQYYYINRPLKFIELSKEEKDVVAFDLKVEGTITTTTELLTLASAPISEAAFDTVTEADFSYIPLKHYDAKLWQDYSTIEPLEEMKQFSTKE